ncbi:4491_t:CDS:2 [Funneliformis caledonium]|uniref:4491_t:CDS:1 n=1 Tax=Funneliformis caledonium TaxID=1117310 RepID=A0A9N8WFF8_9GLOM|nr:4491_t:CDS:2 [Funneliformis caledonium]
MNQQLEEVSQKLFEINSPFTLHQILNDKAIACDFIEWVLLKIDVRLGKNIISPNNETAIGNLSSKQIGRLQSLTQISASLGLCKTTETDLIDATAPHDRLISFYFNLLNILKTSRIFLNDDDSFKIPNSIKPDDFKKSCCLIDSISKDCDLFNKIVTKEIDLFPRDVMLIIGKEKSAEDVGKLDLSILQSMKEKKLQELQDLNAKFNCIQEQEACLYLDESDLDDQTHDELCVIANNLTSQFKTFNEIYDNEISPWIKKDHFKYGEKIVEGHQVQEANKRLEIVSHHPNTVEPQHSVNNNTSSFGSNKVATSYDITNPNMIIINNRGESGLEAITRLQKVEKVLKDGIERRVKIV